MGFSQPFLDSLAADLAAVPGDELDVLERFGLEPYRQKLILIYRRLMATVAETEQAWTDRVRNPRAYPHASEFLADLTLIQESLRPTRASAWPTVAWPLWFVK